jgi:hypothetical protein
MTRNWAGILVLTVIAPGLTGCLQRETTHSLYLSPAGAVAWTAVETDVRSDETDPAKRVAEEQQYLTATGTSSHGIGQGLAALDPARLETHVVRRQRPFVVVTEAEFDRIDRVFERMLAETRTPGYAALVHDGAQTTLVVHMTLGTESDENSSSPVTDLFEHFDRYRIVLTEGRFVAAKGFTLVDGGTAAVPIEISEEQVAANNVVELTLTWAVTSGPRISSGRSSD